MTTTAILLETPRLISVKTIQEICADDGDGNRRDPGSTCTDLLLFQGGRGEIHFDDQVVSVREGDMIIWGLGELPSVHSSPDYSLKGIAIRIGDFRLQDRPAGIILEPESSPIWHLQKNYDMLSRYFTDVLHENSNPKLGSGDLISFLLQSIIIHIVRIINQPKETANISTIAQNARDYIRENYAQDLSLNTLASFVFVSPYHLAHIFKEEIGMSPIQYMIKCRIDEAKRMLSQTELSVREIAQLVGYPNANYFNILFKKMTGESPGKYRKN
ncbi:helix-turn-helix transcriptional regulator [Paenibacillus sp. NPDC058071]|uniref:helix-turn-helix transcriptional regulator n=1 Tax=Paenibacillus sp. NPDC058071 TaxID=3346326 RepID=UPI0036DA575E